MRTVKDDKALAFRLSLIVAFILFLLPFHALLTTWIGSNTGQLDLIKIWKEILITLITPPAFYLAWRTPALKQWLLKSWLAKLIYAYILLHALLAAWALHSHQVDGVSLIYALIINLRFIGFFLICLVLAKKSQFLTKNWPKFVLIPAGLVVFFGLLQRLFLPYDFLKHFGYGPKTIPAYQTVDANLDYRRVQSSLRGANPLGAYLILIITTIFLTLRRQLFWRSLAVLASVAVLFFSYSRSAWIGTVLSLGVLGGLLLGRRMAWRQVLPAVVSMVVVASVGLYFFGSKQSVQDTLLHTSSVSKSSQSSNAVRIKSIRNAAKDVWHNPLGRGPGTAGPASFRNVGHPVRIAENYYLQIGQEVGVLGILIFLAINLLVAQELWKQKAEPLAQILLASLVGITFVNMLSHAWADDTLSLLWWGLAGIAIAPGILSGRKLKNGKLQTLP